MHINQYDINEFHVSFDITSANSNAKNKSNIILCYVL